MASILRRFFGGAASNAGGYAVGGAITPALDPITQALANEMWQKYPDVPLAPEEAANAVARGLRELADGVEEAKRSGTNEARLSLLAQLAAQSPAVEQVLALWRRGEANEDDVDAAFHDQAIRARWRGKLKALKEELVTPEALASLVARGLMDDGAAKAEAARSGIDGDRFDRLVTAASHPPQTAEVLDLWRRGEIGPDDVEEAFHENGIRGVWRGRLKALKEYLVPPSDLVRMGVREVFNPSLRASLDLDAEYPPGITEPGAQVGISEENMRNYWAAHWELPSYTQGAQMLFRGEISQQQFNDLLKALDYAPVWRNKLATIARAIPGVEDFIRFAVREVFNPTQRRQLKLDEDYPPEFTAKAALHGLAEQDARDYWAAHWQLPSPTQGYHMLWRGLISPDELDGLLKALDYSPAWRSKLSDIAHLVPGRIDLRRMLQHKVITREDVRKGYIKLGYTAADAETLTKFAEELAKPTGHQTDWVGRARSRLFTVAHNEYQQASIDETKARATLDLLGAPTEAQDAIIELWNTERSINRLELTPAQIRKAYHNTDPTYPRDVAIAELVERGMTPDDAATFLDYSAEPG